MSPFRSRLQLLSMRVLGCLTVLAAAVSASQLVPATATAASPLSVPLAPHSLAVADIQSTTADRFFVSQARTVRECASNLNRKANCKGAARGLQQAGHRLTLAERRLAKFAGSAAKAHGARAAARSSVLHAPLLAASGQRLTWAKAAHVAGYVVAEKVPGLSARYSVVKHPFVTPPPVPGAIVGYRVRTAASGSLWSIERSIAYSLPAKTVGDQAPGGARTPAAVANVEGAPAITVSGTTLSWNAVAGINTYVLASQTLGQAVRYAVVTGTSTTPSPVPGSTVRYSVRTAVDGSVWAQEVAISYPETAPAPTSTPPVSTSTSPVSTPTPPAPTPTPPVSTTTPPPAVNESATSPAQSSATFQPGMNAGWVYPGQLDLAVAKHLGAKLVRVEFPIEWTASDLEKTIAGYAELGIRVAPLATFAGRLPTPTEAQNLVGWAKAYGPGGTFWSGRSDGQLAIQSIEFGNETSAGYQYGDNAGDPSYTARAETYAVRLKEAAEGISAARTKVGLLAVTGDWTGDWMNGMFSAVPNFGSYVAGWVSHPYGTTWRKTLEEVISQTSAHGAPSTTPIDITEWGLATDNGRCLSENYGWNPCMTYLEAGETLRKTFAEIRQMLGSRLGMFMLYQSRDQQPSAASSEREAYFGLTQHEGQSKGAYTQASEELLAS